MPGSIAVETLAAGFDREQARLAERLAAGGEIGMHPHGGDLVIVEPGTPQAAGIEAEPERLDEMQRGAGVGTEPDDVARVGRNLRLE